jgi:2-polyprenyl-3-methyl-5-hydroxy-6-metoxy-1,4-benzoquinol methylase
LLRIASLAHSGRTHEVAEHDRDGLANLGPGCGFDERRGALSAEPVGLRVLVSAHLTLDHVRSLRRRDARREPGWDGKMAGMADVPDHRGFDEMYVGVPPWDIGSAQPEVVRIADVGGFKGAVIDVGCGTGENALELSARGSAVVGVDAAPRAIEKARAKALERGSSAEFLVADAFSLGSLGRRFDTALDCGVFHVFEDRERPMYVASLASVLEPGGVLHLLCFSDRQPGDMGPRRVSQQELRDSFAEGWDVREIVPTTFVANLPGGGAQAWRATIARHQAP